MKEDETIAFSDHEQWQGQYRGVAFEVCRWNHGSADGDTWNYYIIVKPRRLRRHGKGKDMRVDYYKMYSDVDMHGGITYWCRTVGSWGNHTADKIGCDYAHLWDMDEYTGKRIPRTKEGILHDVKATIDKLPTDLFFKK